MFDNDVSFRVTEALCAALLKAKPESGPPDVPFTITVSRQAGALGRTVAAEIGRRLGWPVYDRELLDQVAERMRQPTFRLEGMDERPVHWLQDCVQAFAAQHHISPTAYVKHLIGVVRGLGLMGHCVIVGRGANCILPAASTVRVRLVAALPDRTRVIARQHGLVEADAARWVAKTDHERTEFVRANFRADPTAAEQYDLVLNTSRLTAAECAQAVIEVLHLFETRRGKKHVPAGEPAGVAP
jgi:cytidylate kinase